LSDHGTRTDVAARTNDCAAAYHAARRNMSPVPQHCVMLDHSCGIYDASSSYLSSGLNDAAGHELNIV
jgi:hypothetical protein